MKYKHYYFNSWNNPYSASNYSCLESHREPVIINITVRPLNLRHFETETTMGKKHVFVHGSGALKLLTLLLRS